MHLPSEKNRIWYITAIIITVIIVAFFWIFFQINSKKPTKGISKIETTKTDASKAEAEKANTSEEFSDEKNSSIKSAENLTTQSETDKEPAMEEQTTKETAAEQSVIIEECNETVWALTDVNIRQSYTADSNVVGSLLNGRSIQRTGVCDNGWSRVLYNGQEAFINSRYLTVEEIVTEAPSIEDITVSPENFYADIFQDKYTANTLKINHPEFDISDSLKNEFADILRYNPSDIRFYAISLDERLSFGYNPDNVYFAACTVKAGFAMNLYKQVELGRLDLTALMTYEEGMFHGGSGIIRDEPYGTIYTIQQLIDYSLLYSDNIAYDMIRDMKNRYYVASYDQMIEQLGCTSSKLGSKNWANTTTRDMVKIMREIYRYSQSSEYGNYLLQTLKNTDWNYYSELIPEYECAAKIGYIEGTSSMTGIVFGEVPYILCISTAREDEELKPLIVLCNKIVNEYIEYRRQQN